jgi:hypothetical protein
MDLTLPIDNVVHISLSAAPQGANVKNVNNIAIFSKDTPGNSDSYREYIRSSDVGTDYGTASVIKAMADMIFSQDKTPLSGGGKLIIIPLKTKLIQTAGYFTTVDLTSKLAAIIGKDDGDLRITLGGNIHDLTGLDFTDCTTIAQVAAVLQAAITTALAVVTSTATAIIITNSQVGSGASIAVGAVPGGAGTDMSGSSYFNTAGGSATPGTASQEAVASATSGYFTTADLTSKLAAIILVGNGDLKVVLNGTNINLNGLDFTACVTIADVAAVLQEALPDLIITSTATAIKFQSKKVGDEADVTLGSVAGGTGTDISGANYLTQATGSATSGTDATGESVVDAIARIEGAVNFCGVMTNLDIEDDVVEATALAIQATGRIFIHHFASSEDILGIATTIKNASYKRTRCLLYRTSLAAANLMKCAYVGRMFSTNFAGSKTVQTSNLKTLIGIVPDVLISQTVYAAALLAGMDLYVSYEGVAGVFSTSGNGWFDSVYNQLALQFYLQTAGFNALKQVGTKVPQTEAGMNALKSAYGVVFKAFKTNGYIGEGLTWNSAEVFGNPEDLKRNITDLGFYMYSIPVATQSQVDRDARIAPLIQCAVKESGAIHSSDVSVIVEA